MNKRESVILEFIEKHKLLREREILEIVPISRKAWLDGVEAGDYPKPIRWGKKLKFWREQDIIELLTEGTK